MASTGAYTKEWCLKNPERAAKIQRTYRASEKGRRAVRARQYKSKYGISIEQYDEMLLAQKRLCAICNQPETSIGVGGRVKPLFVDHCHTTKKVRKLLCDHCNQVIGRAKDNIQILEKAIQYLKEN